jgi:hypothetical protein
LFDTGERQVPHHLITDATGRGARGDDLPVAGGDSASDAWSKLEAQPSTIMSIGMRDWAHRFRTVNLGLL